VVVVVPAVVVCARVVVPWVVVGPVVEVLRDVPVWTVVVGSDELRVCVPSVETPAGAVAGGRVTAHARMAPRPASRRSATAIASAPRREAAAA
jgi:hypothetical protein